jgi:hypothetical protein
MMRRTPLRPGTKPLRARPAKKKVKKLARPRVQPIKTVTRRAWDAFSKYVRLRDARYESYASCVTCENLHDWKDMQAGHLVHASKRSPVSYDERNVHAQCPQCNLYGMKLDKAIVYTRVVQRRYGANVPDELLSMKLSGKFLTRAELEKKARYYESKVEEMLNGGSSADAGDPLLEIE